MKVLNVVGARPNFMKVAPLVEAMKRREREFTPLVLHTGQHYDASMSDAFFRDLELPKPDVYLGVGSSPQITQLAEIMRRFEPVLKTERPDWVLVVGDVNSTLACALTCVKTGYQFAHVEAGLRSGDRSMPEEINRLLTDRVADLLFTPSEDGDKNLLSEGIPPERIRMVGNIMIDSLLKHLPAARQSNVRSKLGLCGIDYAVVTLHRPSNVDEPLVFERIICSLAEISKRLPVIFPAHPRTRKIIERLGLTAELKQNPRLMLTEPLGYLDFLGLFSGAKLVLTDSGGIQEETTVLGIPCLTLRENTERPITVELGTNRLVGTRAVQILTAVNEILDGTERRTATIPELWDGKTADRILNHLAQRSSGGK
jgi:UDP-N-acetylglucosamine 2-epimerase (non-hydrolysing)